MLTVQLLDDISVRFLS